MATDPAALREAWESKYRREPAPWRGPAEMGPLARFLAALPPGARVLELGAGGGKTLAELQGLRPVGLDWSRGALARLRGERVQAEAAAIPFRPATFDAVLAVHVLGHLPAARRAEAAREAIRALKPGGCLLFADFAQGDLRAGKGAAVPEEPGTRVRDQGILYHYFSTEQVVSLFSPLRPLLVEEEVKPERFGGIPYERRVLRAAFEAPKAPQPP